MVIPVACVDVSLGTVLTIHYVCTDYVGVGLGS